MNSSSRLGLQRLYGYSAGFLYLGWFDTTRYPRFWLDFRYGLVGSTSCYIWLLSQACYLGDTRDVFGGLAGAYKLGIDRYYKLYLGWQIDIFWMFNLFSSYVWYDNWDSCTYIYELH